MKKQIIIFAAISLLFGCRNEAPSTVDNKTYNLDENINANVKPGDDFFMYSNGAWWDKTNMQGKDFAGFMVEAQEVSSQRLANVNSAPIKEFLSKIDNVDNTSQAAVELLKEHLKLTENITNSAQAQDAIVKLITEGYDIVEFVRSPYEGFVPFMIAFSPNFNFDFNWVRHSLEQLGVQDADARVEKANILYELLKNNQTPITLSYANIEKHPELLDRMVSLNSTKATGSQLLDKLLQAFKVDFKNALIDRKVGNFFLEFEKADPEMVKCLLQLFIANKYQFTSSAAYSEFQSFVPNAPSFDKVINSFKQNSLMYLNAYVYSKQYVSAEMKSKMHRYCEEIRTAFSDRIEQADWMSETTKQKAKEKLQAMSFNVGSPDTWIESALPTSLKGRSMLEDVFTLKVSKNKLYEDRPMPASEMYFHIILAKEVAIESINAFYVPSINAMYILPSWLLEPMYDESKSDAYNYAIFSVIGHEITHGFDNQGSKFNKIGKSENWWTVADQMEFNRRQQMLVDCYNLLEIFPTELPNVFADGKKTLGENIADLGGSQLAFYAYNAKLLAEGYNGDELVKQQKRFFQSYANLWRNKYTAGFTIDMLDDPHSLSKERVNGVVMNVDLWYDLYDVKWGDKLYLSPEKRTYIW